MQEAYVVTGTLYDEHTVRLDEPVPLGSIKVRVRLEPLRSRPQRAYLEVMSEIRERQRARQHRPPTREEVDRYVRAERESWEQ